MRTLVIKASMIGMTIMAAAAAMPAAAGPQYYGASGGTIRCESNDGGSRECATGGGRVVMARQISNSACIEGRSWGYSRNGIWVSQGCRADFRLVADDRYQSGEYSGNDNGSYRGNYGDDDSDNDYRNSNNGYGNSNNQEVRCESTDGRTRACPMDTRGGVQLVRKRSSSACIEGRSWGSNRGGVWVTDGCRADFRRGGGYDSNGGYSGYESSRGYSDNGYYGNSYGIGGQVFRCESTDGQARGCWQHTRAGVQLVRILSKSPCIQGRSWGYGRNGIWVTDGCRAEFRAY
jgi:hypothetical protein